MNANFLSNYDFDRNVSYISKVELESGDYPSINDTKEFNSLIRNLFINMSHELKTPVNVMYSAIQAIGINCEDCSVNRKRAYIKSMKQNQSQKIRKLLQEIKTLSSDLPKGKRNQISNRCDKISSTIRKMKS